VAQADTRGNRATRVEKALAKIEALKPDHIVCKNCQAHLTDLVTLESSHMEGIEAAFAARCELCDQDTWALKAGTNAVADVSTAIDSVTRGVGKIGVTNKPKS
jgi:Zn finger protein HypA/HybF involved in hydrogenase expression